MQSFHFCTPMADLMNPHLILFWRNVHQKSKLFNTKRWHLPKKGTISLHARRNGPVSIFLSSSIGWNLYLASEKNVIFAMDWSPTMYKQIVYLKPPNISPPEYKPTQKVLTNEYNPRSFFVSSQATRWAQNLHGQQLETRLG